MLKYEQIPKAILAQFPELTRTLQRKFGSYYDLRTEIPGAYPLFEDVFANTLLDLLRSTQEIELLSRMFSFVDLMAASEDLEVQNLLWIGLLERLLSEPALLSKAWSFMDPATKEKMKNVAAAHGLDRILPVGG